MDERLEACLRGLSALTPKPPNAITYDRGVEILNYVQDKLCPLVDALPPLKSGTEPPSDFAEFQVFDDGEFYAEACGPREQAFAEAFKYALECSGVMRVEEITRRPIVFDVHKPNCSEEA